MENKGTTVAKSPAFLGTQTWIWKKRFLQLHNGIRNWAFAAHLRSLLGIISIVTALHLSSDKSPFDVISLIKPWLPRSQTMCWELVACSLSGLYIWICICLIMRFTLRLLLTYKGWMHEPRGRGTQISVATKLWSIVIRAVLSWNEPRLYSFQRSLPRIPVPSIDDTIARYLDSFRPLLSDDEFKLKEKQAYEFKQTIATELQGYLVLKSLFTPNYISDWWEKYIYLSTLMINNNYYGTDVRSVTCESQLVRASVLTHLILRVRESIERQHLKPIMAQSYVPLCSQQYERAFNTVRIPGIGTDEIIHYEDSDHIAVIHNGCYYKVTILNDGEILSPKEIEVQLDSILRSTPQLGEEHLAALTAWSRKKWAETRQIFFRNGINAKSLHAIESAAFVLCLDDQPYETDEGKGLHRFAATALHGNGHNRWFDKSITVCVGRNGRVGFNAEHTWGDATVVMHIWEDSIMEEMRQGFYDEKGNCKGTVEEVQPPAPERLQWDLKGCMSRINEACNDAQELINDVQVHVLRHKFGKESIKKCRVSPDAFIQMAFQLAYYRDFKKVTLTYESSMTRLFRHGRTETVRSVTMESVAWVKAMDNSSSSIDEKISLFQKACQRHQIGYQDCMIGKGIDRHLFCLSIVAKQLGLNSPFLNEALSEPFRLSTSQTPMNLSGGFGPVAIDGYGISYMIVGDNEIYFHVTSRKSSSKICNPGTDAVRFAKRIEQALYDILKLFGDKQ